jgi:hypothetical protein
VNTALIVQFEFAGTVSPQLFVCEKSPAFAPVIEIPEIESVAFPVLNSVTPPVALDDPTAVFANAMVDELKLTAGAVPTPVTAALCGLPGALSAIDTLACRVPAALGVNVTLIAQLVPWASDVPQLLVCAKSVLLVPVIVIEVMLKAAFPELLRVRILAELVVPRGWLPKLRLVGERPTAGAIPVPVRGAVCGLPAALSLTEMLAVREPDAVGVNVAVTEQDAPAASDAPQVFVCEKSPLFVPVMLTDEIVRAAVPALVSVTTLAGLLVPTV